MDQLPSKLKDGATIAIVGGGPAGTFSAIHLINQATKHGLGLRIVIFERNCSPETADTSPTWGAYEGCPQCAGGISPPLYRALESLDIPLSPEIVQSDISSITVQGNWKSVILPVPRDQKLLSVYRGTLPFTDHHRSCFDAMMLSIAQERGAQLIGAAVCRVGYDDRGRVNVYYRVNSKESELNADLVVFAGGVNEKPGKSVAVPGTVELMRQLQPDYNPPHLRKALIFELAGLAQNNKEIPGELHFIESSSGRLQLEMCSILSKRGYLTVTLIGKSVDAAVTHQQNLRVIRDFMKLPQIQDALPRQMQPRIQCVCNPNLVVGTASKPFGNRVAAVGDMATCRQYKDGILSAHNTADALAAAALEEGVDQASLKRGYGPLITRFRKDNRYAAIIFFLYRWFFISPAWSRIIYQTYASEKKSKPERKRSFKHIFWAISSGDGSYRDIAWAMLRPSTLWMILWGGFFVTLRNRLTELIFGLEWHGIGRVPTVVSTRELETKRASLLPADGAKCLKSEAPEFECIYTVRVRCNEQDAWSLLAEFGEEKRPYLNPRWVKIRRTHGVPLEPGCVINYSVFGGFISFSIEQQANTNHDLLVYKVNGGFAHGGYFVFEVDPLSSGHCDLTVYLGFNYARGNSLPARVYWRFFKLLFPESIHDVLWNHALCEFRQQVENSVDLASQAPEEFGPAAP
ncbi:MAG: hypothetical protein V7720_04065 [Halioglobus sp.]